MIVYIRLYVCFYHSKIQSLVYISKYYNIYLAANDDTSSIEASVGNFICLFLE